MTDAAILAHFDEFVIQFLFWAGVVAVSVVSIFWPWWKTDLGRTIVLEISCLCAALFPSTLELELGVNANTIFWQWWVGITFFGAAIVTLWRIPVIWKYQRYARNLTVDESQKDPVEGA